MEKWSNKRETTNESGAADSKNSKDFDEDSFY